MFKILRQELLFLPLMLLFVELFRGAVAHYYPETALSDRGSELETFLFRVWQMVWITSAAWVLLAVIFPPGFKNLRKFYNTFERYSDDQKEKMSLQAWAFFVLCMVLLLSGRAQTETKIRQKLTDTLTSQLYVRELTGNNDGVEVERYLGFVGMAKGNAWCAAFVSYNLNAVGVSKPINPISAWAPVFANPKYIVWSQSLLKANKAKKPKPGDCFTLYYPAQNRVGHVGFIIGESGLYFITTEGNTGLSGSREGSGVHRLKRAKSKVYAITDYITPYLKQHEKVSFYNGAYRVDMSLLQSQNYQDAGKGLPADRQLLCAKGLYLVQGLHDNYSRGQLQDRSNCKTGFSREYKPASYCYTNEPLQNKHLYYKRKAESRLCLQRAGTSCTDSGAPDTGIQKSLCVQAKGHRKRNQPRKADTRMG
jgi:hypothetical protein